MAGLNFPKLSIPMQSEDLPKRKLQLSPKEAKIRAGAFCAYQERTQQQVRDKLYTYGLHYEEVEQVLTELITEGYVNEERFARAYAGGKFRMKKWGRRKILQGLKQHHLSDYCIKKAMEEIDPEEYMHTLTGLANKKWGATPASSLPQKKQKVANYLLSKGFENDLVWESLAQFG
jgi:regulatory protein